MGWLAWGTAPW